MKARMTPKWECGSLWGPSEGKWGILLASWLAAGWLAGHRDPQELRDHGQRVVTGRSPGAR